MKIKNIENLLQEINILDLIKRYLNTVKKGNNYLAVCPFHDDHKPSLFISENKQIFKCFSCNTGGNAIRFLMLYKKITFKEAVLEISNIFGLNLENQFNLKEKKYDHLKPLIKVNQDALNFFKIDLLNNEISLNYLLKERKFKKEIIEIFELGFDSYSRNDSKNKLWNFLKIKKNDEKDLETSGLFLNNEKHISYFRKRIIFPIYNENNFLVGFSGRTLNEKENYAKYLNSKESELFHKNDLLYNFNYVIKNFLNEKEIYLVEGLFDVLRLTENKYPAIALMGTFLNDKQTSAIKQYFKNIVIFPDPDDAGIKSSLRSAIKLLHSGLNVEILLNSEKTDPDEFLKNEKNDLKKLARISPAKFLIKSYEKNWVRKNYELFINLLQNFLLYLTPFEKQEINDLLKEKYDLTLDNLPIKQKIKKNFLENKTQKDNKWKIVLFVQILKTPQILDLFSDINVVFFNGKNFNFDYWYLKMIKWYKDQKNKNKIIFDDFYQFIKNDPNSNKLKEFYDNYNKIVEVNDIDYINKKIYEHKFILEKETKKLEEIQAKLKDTKNKIEETEIINNFLKVSKNIKNIKQKIKQIREEK